KSFEQGREKLQGAGIHLIWCDEDTPPDIFSELCARTFSTAGIIFVTFTPIKGMLPVAERFLQEPSPARSYVVMTLSDALHIPVERTEAIIAQIPTHERDARVYGIPSAGEGKVFLTDEAAIAEEPLPYIPPYWPCAWGVDFGIAHPFAAVLGAWDRSNDVIHIIHCIRIRGGLPINHAHAMRTAMEGRAADVIVLWPHDGAVRSKESGRSTMQLYKEQGLRMAGEHTTFPQGGFDFEAGIFAMAQRFAAGKLRVAKHLHEFWEEYRLYHRKDGQVVKLRDDLMSASRILCMGIRRARELTDHRPGFVPGQVYQPQRQSYIAANVDFDVFGLG